MSVPPVVAPLLNTSPSPTAIKAPPASAARKGSSVIGPIGCKALINIDVKDVQYIVDKIKRNLGMKGLGASVFFHKEMYNRKRMAKFGFITKTLSTYFLISVAFCGFSIWSGVKEFSILAFIFATVIFFRSFANPLAVESTNHWLALVPDDVYAKVFYCMLAGSTACVLDLLPGFLLAIIVTKANIGLAVLWFINLVVLDFMVSSTGAMFEAILTAEGLDNIKASFQLILKMILVFILIGALTVGLIIANMYVGLIILAYIITKLLRVSKKEMGAYMVMFVFSNIAFMGYPVISGIYGKGALLYASLFSLPFNILIYTYGVLAIGGSTKLSDLKISKILNIGVLACIVSIILFATRIPMPGFVQTLTDMLGNLSAPLSMMVIGSSLVKMDIKSVLNDYKMIIFIVVKQLIFPILAAFAIKGLIDSELIYGIVVIMLAMPVGSMTAMLANQYNGDYELVSKGVAFSTLVSVISIPLISVIVGL